MVITFGMILAACSQVDPSMLDATLIAPQPLQLLKSTNPALPGNPGIPSPSPTSTAQAEEQTPQATSTPVSTPDPGLGVDPGQLTGLTIQFWHPWSGETAQVVQELVDEFNLTNELGIQVEMQAPGSLESLSEEVRAALPTGKTPDLIAAYLFEAQSLSAYQPLVDLTPYIEDDNFGLEAGEQADFIPALWDGDQFNGKRLGVPAIGSGQVLFYNQSWAEELGFSEPPTTPQELEQQACRAAQANREDADPDNDGSGGLALSTQYSAVLGWLAGFGGEVYDPAKTQGSQNPYDFGSKAVEEAFTFLRSLYDRGCAWLPEEPYPEDAFASRRA
jgi:multiple sugar transport system substrate-binding protein